MITLKNVSKTYNYKKENAFLALDGVNISIGEGEMVAIMGKSGSGKSTLMHLIGLLDDYEEGEYWLDGVQVNSLHEGKKARLRNEKIGIVMQNYALVDTFSVLENVMIPLDFSKAVGKKKEKALAALDQVGMKELSKKSVTKLSGGQKQRVAIARALVNDPMLILADEPTGALDSKTAGEIMDIFCSLKKQGKTLVIITHDEDVAKRCDRIVRIADGKIDEADDS